jgi:hypothetical protein
MQNNNKIVNREPAIVNREPAVGFGAIIGSLTIHG